MMAGPPASLSARDVGFVSLSSATLSAPFPPAGFCGKLGLVGNLWVPGREAEARWRRLLLRRPAPLPRGHG